MTARRLTAAGAVLALLALPARARALEETWTVDKNANGKYIRALPTPTVGTNPVRLQDVTGVGYLRATALNTLPLTFSAAIPVADVTGAVATTRTLTAGAGMTGGGDLSANRTFNIIANADATIVVNADDVQAGVMQTANIANSAITYAKLQNVAAASRVLCRGSASGAGVMQECTLGTGLAMTGTVLSATGSGTVTAVTATPPLLSSGGATPELSLQFDNTTLTLTGGDALQRAALSGAITATAGSNTTAFGALAATSVLANATGSPAVPAALVAGADNLPLRRASGVLDFGTIPVASVIGAESALTFTSPLSRSVDTISIATNGIGDSLIRQSAALSLVGNGTNASANVGDIIAGSDGCVYRRSGTTVGCGTIGVGSVPALAATFITQTPSSDFANEQALSALATGYMRSTTVTGAVTTTTTVPATDISGLTAAQVGFGSSGGALTSSSRLTFTDTGNGVLRVNNTTLTNRLTLSPTGVAGTLATASRFAVGVDGGTGLGNSLSLYVGSAAFPRVLMNSNVVGDDNTFISLQNSDSFYFLGSGRSAPGASAELVRWYVDLYVDPNIRGNQSGTNPLNEHWWRGSNWLFAGGPSTVDQDFHVFEASTIGALGGWTGVGSSTVVITGPTAGSGIPAANLHALRIKGAGTDISARIAGGVRIDGTAANALRVSTFGAGNVVSDASGQFSVDATTYAPTSRTLTAGAGMTGGGTLAADRTFDVVAGDATLVVGANSMVAGVMQTANIADDAVTNAKAANMATARIKGRVTSGTGDPEDLTGTQATTLLDTFTASSKGLVPPGGAAAGTFLQFDGTWAVPPGTGGGGTITSVSGTLGRISSTGGTAPILDLVATGVTAATYTYATVAVDIYGRITSAADGTTPASAAAHFLTDRAEAGLSAEVNLGGQSGSGVQQTVISAGVATFNTFAATVNRIPRGSGTNGGLTDSAGLLYDGTTLISTSSTTSAEVVHATSAITNHLSPTAIVESSAATGQALIALRANGAVRGGLRADYLGNVVLVSQGGDQYFFTGGDTGVGTQRMLISGSTGAVTINSLGTGMVKSTSGALANATAGVDYQAPFTWPGSGDEILASNGSGGPPNAYTNFTYDGGELALGLSAVQSWYNVRLGVSWERVRAFWSGNVWSLKSEAAGVGVVRPISINADTAALTLSGSNVTVTPLAGSGTRAVTADAGGNLGTMTITRQANLTFDLTALSDSAINTSGQDIPVGTTNAFPGVVAHRYTLGQARASVILGAVIISNSFTGGGSWSLSVYKNGVTTGATIGPFTSGSGAVESTAIVAIGGTVGDVYHLVYTTSGTLNTAASDIRFTANLTFDTL